MCRARDAPADAGASAHRAAMSDGMARDLGRYRAVLHGAPACASSAQYVDAIAMALSGADLGFDVRERVDKVYLLGSASERGHTVCLQFKDQTSRTTFLRARATVAAHPRFSVDAYLSPKQLAQRAALRPLRDSLLADGRTAFFIYERLYTKDAAGQLQRQLPPAPGPADAAPPPAPATAPPPDLHAQAGPRQDHVPHQVVVVHAAGAGSVDAQDAEMEQRALPEEELRPAADSSRTTAPGPVFRGALAPTTAPQAASTGGAAAPAGRAAGDAAPLQPPAPRSRVRALRTRQPAETFPPPTEAPIRLFWYPDLAGLPDGRSLASRDDPGGAL